jgi:hypothetical protein
MEWNNQVPTQPGDNMEDLLAWLFNANSPLDELALPPMMDASAALCDQGGQTEQFSGMSTIDTMITASHPVNEQGCIKAPLNFADSTLGAQQPFNLPSSIPSRIRIAPNEPSAPPQPFHPYPVPNVPVNQAQVTFPEEWEGRSWTMPDREEVLDARTRAAIISLFEVSRDLR